MTTVTKKEVKEAFLAKGYRVDFKTNRFDDKLCTLYIDSLAGEKVLHGLAFTAQTVVRHREAFNLFHRYQGRIMRNGQKII